MAKAVVVFLLLAGCGDAAVDTYARALEALRKGDLGNAEALAEEAAATGDENAVARAEFLRGNAAFQRCLIGEQQATQPGAEPFAFDVAIAYADKARRLWQIAAMSPDNWPAARRNVERALLKLDQLRKKKQAKQDEAKKADPDPRPKPKPQAKPKPKQDKRTEDGKDDPQLKELSPEEVVKLIEKLAQKEREKVGLRKVERKTRSAGVERDW